MTQPEIVFRARRAPNHHLFDNHGTYWVRYCVREDPRLKPRRVAVSLGTACLDAARERRDALLHALTTGASAPGNWVEQSVGKRRGVGRNRPAEPDKRYTTSGSNRRAGE